MLATLIAVTAAAAAAVAPSPEAVSLGRQIAENGTLGAILPMMQGKESNELVAEHPELSDTEKAKLKAIADETYKVGYGKIMDAEGRAWAERLSMDEMRTVIAFQTGTTGQHYRAVLPQVVGATMKTLGDVHFKEDVIAAFCRETGKLCAPK